jgi:signal transduction histidine kinase
MREQVERLTRLATDLLDLSRLDAGRLRVEALPLELGPLARELVDEFRGLALAGGHELEAVGPGDAVALADEQRTQQVARALVGNALRHTPAGTAVRVEVRADGENARLTVEDDGPGIPAEHAAHVFERFYRIDGRLASGSGLGLAIARELARAMDGSLEVESQPGRTVFRLRLPVGTREALTV